MIAKLRPVKLLTLRAIGSRSQFQSKNAMNERDQDGKDEKCARHPSRRTGQGVDQCQIRPINSSTTTISTTSPRPPLGP